MVICALQGGMGNQMFQYATSVGIAQQDEAIFLDLQLLHDQTGLSASYTPRQYSLGIFTQIRLKHVPPLIHKIFNRNELVWRTARRLVSGKIRRVGQYNNEFHPELLSRNYSVYLDGYFQSEKYFREKRKRLLHDFSFPELDKTNADLSDEISGRRNAVSIHIRRGDYLKPDVLEYHGTLPLEYYQHAIAQIRDKVSDPYFYVFSEDVDWCQANLGFLDGRMTLVGNINARDAWKDMYLMTRCRHHIIANSSFSWWGAWLAQQDGLNFAPAEWFNSKAVSFNIHDFIPESWTIVRNA